MYIGNTEITGVYIGNTPINEVWWGSNLVWESDAGYTYTIDSLSVSYSTGSSVLPTGANYAYVTGRVRKYKNGKLETTLTNYKLPISEENQYVYTMNNNIYFDVDRWGTNTMASMSNPFEVDVYTSFSGTTGPTAKVKVTPNRVSSTNITDTICDGSSSADFLTSGQTMFTIYNFNKGVATITYTSGKQRTENRDIDGYLFMTEGESEKEEMVGTISAGGSIEVSVSRNNSNYPRIYKLRLSDSYDMSDEDYLLGLMHKCRSTTTRLNMFSENGEALDGAYIYGQEYMYVCNNSHTYSTNYTIQNNSSGVITELNGVFLIKYAPGEYYADGSITITDNNGYSCTFQYELY